MKDIPEYEEMTPEDRRAAYEKFVKRQQEKLREDMDEGPSDRKLSRMDIDPSEDKERRSKDKERDYEKSKRDSYKDKDRDGDRHRRDSDRKKKYSEEPDERDRDKKRPRRDSVVSNAKSRSESISNSKRDDDVEEGEI